MRGEMKVQATNITGILNATNRRLSRATPLRKNSKGNSTPSRPTLAATTTRDCTPAIEVGKYIPKTHRETMTYANEGLEVGANPVIQINRGAIRLKRPAAPRVNSGARYFELRCPISESSMRNP